MNCVTGARSVVFFLAIAPLWACSDGVESLNVDDEASKNVWFVEEARARGVEFIHESGFREQHLLPEITGGGAALADFNNDGHLDLYLVQSGSLYEDETDRVRNELYFNDGDGTFTKAADANGANDDGYGMGVVTGDYDNDGDVDLYVTNYGGNVLYRNDGTGNFEDLTLAAGAGDDGWSTSGAFLDLDVDGDLDLFFANYMNWTAEAELDCYTGGILTYCPPTNYQLPAIDQLFRNNGDGTFTRMTEEAGLPMSFGNGFGVVSADYNDDGLLDVFVANDLMLNQFWLNQGNLQFVDAAMSWGSAADGFGQVKAGMGVSSADVDQDGDFDVLVVNLSGASDSYSRNEGTHFVDATGQVGLRASSKRYTRFGVVMADFDNDGHLDLYHANGAVGPSDVREDDLFAEPNLLFKGTVEGKFEEIDFVGGTRDELRHTSRGAAVGDVDNDGALDLVVVNRDAAPYLLMNARANLGNWVLFVVKSRENRYAHSAIVSISVDGRRMYGAVRPEGSYLSANDPRVHFGIAEAERISQVEVEWLTGERESFGDFQANQIVELRQGHGTVATAPEASD